MSNIYHTQTVFVNNMSDLDSLNVNAGAVVTVGDMGNGHYGSFLFPYAGLGNHSERKLIASSQTMSDSKFSATVSVDMQDSGTDYLVFSETFTSPYGVNTANVSAWAVAADESTTTNLSQMVTMYYRVLKASDNSIVFNPSARPRASMPLANDVSSSIVERRSVFLSLTDSAFGIEENTQYNIEMYMSKHFSVGPTRFREGLIKVNWH